MAGKGVTIGHEALRGLTRDLIAAGGSEAAEAAIVADHLVEANLRGHDSHGVGMIPHYVRNLKFGKLRPNTHARFEREESAFAVVDGQMGYGQVVAREAIDWAIRRAKEGGVAVLALRNAHHIGRVGAYGEQACEAGLVSLHFVNGNSGPPRVAPFRGIDGRFSTNPLCIAVPGSGDAPPIVLDMATSRIAIGKVRVAYNEGKRVPAGALIDAQGRPTDDPAVIYEEPKGCVVPFGEHKGYALAVICELLAGAVAGAGGIRLENPSDRIVNGMLSFVLEPGRLVDLAWMRREIEAIVGHAKEGRPADPALPVLVPGDPERISRENRMREGIPIDATTWRDIAEAARAVGFASERFDAALRAA